MVAEHFSIGRAHQWNRKPKKQSPRFASPAGSDGIKESFREISIRSRQRCDLRHSKFIEFRHIASQAATHEVCNECRISSGNVHRRRRTPMFDPRTDLYRAIKIRTGPGRIFYCITTKLRAAFSTGV
jgi:hypothetical protein